MGKSLGTVIQTQAPINPGNSGGPLMTGNGDLIGVITWSIKLSRGLSAAIGINEVKSFVNEQMSKRELQQ
jgi:S1-C subfamily serine protease